jgi:hypothetical protein
MELEWYNYYVEGGEETCDDCYDLYPVCWMVMCDNAQIRCFDCWQKNLKQEEEYRKTLKTFNVSLPNQRTALTANQK